jgi:hypothetical protein
MLPGALVNVTKESTTVATNAKTDSKGSLDIPVSMDGTLKITVSKDEFVPASTNTSLEFPEHCNKTILVELEEKTCPNSIMPVTVLNGLTKEPIVDALISLILKKTLTPAAPPKHTNENGTVVFSVPMNGDYIVGVSAEGFDPVEEGVTQDCDHDNCAACAPSLVLHPPPTFCPNKKLHLTLLDCLNSSRLAGASITTTFVTDDVTIQLGTFNSSESGEVELPLNSNGIYNSIVNFPGYITIRHSYQVEVDLTDCATYTPQAILPLCPPPQPGCIDVSLTWTGPVDLDLYSVRVPNDNIEDVCESKPSCCNGCKKEECPGVTPHTDTTEGKNGTETITYCGVDTYSDMIFIEDADGTGLSSSGARLFITNGDEKRFVEIPRSGASSDSRFWLAGCLTNEGFNFTFEQLSQYSVESPKKLDPLKCHDETALKRLDSPLPNSASITVEVLDSRNGEPLLGATVHVGNTWVRITRVVGDDGKAKIRADKVGPYTIMATKDGFLPDEHKIEFICNSEDTCQQLVTLSLVPTDIKGQVDIVLNWGSKASDLDLHTLQVDLSSPEIVCETFSEKRKLCENAVVKQTMNRGEMLTISDLDSSSKIQLHDLC